MSADDYYGVFGQCSGNQNGGMFEIGFETDRDDGYTREVVLTFEINRNKVFTI